MVTEEFLKELKAGTTGLVIAGGGFKGAYHVGVWKALREAGADRFDCVAGTSAGALNAILIANGEVGQAEKLWEEFPGLKRAWGGVGAYLAGYALTVGPLILTLVLCPAAVVVGLLGFSTTVMGAMLGAAFVCGFFGFLSLAVTGIGTVTRRVFLTIGQWQTVLLLAVISLIFSVAGPVMATTTLVWLHLLQANPAAVQPDLSWWTGLLALLGLILGGAVAGYGGVRLLWFAQRNANIFSNEDLLATLRGAVMLDAIKRNVNALFITTARSASVWNPFGMEVERNPLWTQNSFRDQYRVVDGPALETAGSPTTTTPASSRKKNR